jgi:hypothetical protein
MSHVHRIHEAVALYEDVIEDWCKAPPPPG